MYYANKKCILNAEVITGQITSRKFMSGLRVTDKDLKACGKQACSCILTHIYIYIYIIQHTHAKCSINEDSKIQKFDVQENKVKNIKIKLKLIKIRASYIEYYA